MQVALSTHSICMFAWLLDDAAVSAFCPSGNQDPGSMLEEGGSERACICDGRPAILSSTLANDMNGTRCGCFWLVSQ